MNVDAYLRRISYDGPQESTAETLRRLHRAHMLAVPFENLDIHLGHHIKLDRARFYDKIVRQRRGGFCYELNGLFAWLLKELGFEVEKHSARAYGTGGLGAEFDHLILQIRLETSWLVDVGFGDSFLEPLPLVENAECEQVGSLYRLSRSGDTWTLWRRQPATDWERRYQFSPRPRRLAEFSAMCEWHQTSPESIFTRNRLCSLATDRGRITLSGMQFILTEDGRREERSLDSEAEYRRTLAERFGIELDAEHRSPTDSASGRGAP